MSYIVRLCPPGRNFKFHHPAFFNSCSNFMQSFFLLRYSIPFSRKSLLFLPFSNSHFASYFASFQIFGFFFPGISCAIPWRVSSAQKTICSRSFSLFFRPPRGGGCIFLFLRQQPFLILPYLHSFSLFWVWSPLLTPFSSFFCPFFSVAPRGPFYLTNILFWSFFLFTFG